MHLIDSHAHLHFPQFDEDRKDVIDRARAAGLVAVINVGTDLASTRAAVSLAETEKFVYATVGVHPHHAEELTDAVLGELRQLSQHPKVVAIGEIGLDYYRDYTPRPIQREAFRRQLDLAAEVGLPIVVHSREAHDEVLDTLRGWEGTGVLHSYAGGPERLDAVMELGFRIGISGPVTFSSAEDLRKVAGRVPLDRLLVETDCPYLTPIPYRGKRNEPAYVRYVVNEIAEARGVPEAEVARATVENAKRLFGLPEDP